MKNKSIISKITKVKTVVRKKAKPVYKDSDKSFKWHLKLYIAGKTGRSQIALKNLELLCEKYLKGKYELEIIDLLK